MDDFSGLLPNPRCLITIVPHAFLRRLPANIRLSLSALSPIPMTRPHGAPCARSANGSSAASALFWLSIVWRHSSFLVVLIGTQVAQKFIDLGVIRFAEVPILEVRPMSRALVKPSRIKPPAGLAKLFADPPLAGDEAREDYESLFCAIASAAKPTDAIAWLFVRDITDLSWEICRERNLKIQVIKSAQTDVVRALLTPSKPFPPALIINWEVDPNDEKIAKEAKQWASDPKARRRIDKELAEKGYDATHILTRALNEAAGRIDAIDGRIASYELRRMAALRTVDQYSETLARRLKAASSEIIEGQFTEAAE